MERLKETGTGQTLWKIRLYAARNMKTHSSLSDEEIGSAIDRTVPYNRADRTPCVQTTVGSDDAHT